MCRCLLKGYGSSWIFEPRLTSANALRRVQQRAFSLGNSGTATTGGPCLCRDPRARSRWRGRQRGGWPTAIVGPWQPPCRERRGRLDCRPASRLDCRGACSGGAATGWRPVARWRPGALLALGDIEHNDQAVLLKSARLANQPGSAKRDTTIHRRMAAGRPIPRARHGPAIAGNSIAGNS